MPAPLSEAPPTNGQAIDSDALRANLRETAQAASIEARFLPLLDMVRQMHGIAGTLEGLLCEISHSYRNWALILPNLRSFVLKHIGYFLRHDDGPLALELFGDILFSALFESKKNDALATRAMETILALLDRILAQLDAGGLARHQRAVDAIFCRLARLDHENPPLFLLLVKNQHPFKAVCGRLSQLAPADTAVAADLLQKSLTVSYRFWLAEEDPVAWLERKCQRLQCAPLRPELFSSISHARLRELTELARTTKTLMELQALPDHIEIVRAYKNVVASLPAGGNGAAEPQDGIENLRLLFLYLIMENAGLELIHEETLREINRSLSLLIHVQPFEDIEEFLLTAFHLLKANVTRYPHTALQCIQAIGSDVFRRGNSQLAEAFLWETVRFGFQYPNFTGMDEDWQPIANPAHLANIRCWLSLIMQEPKWCATLFSALIINIRLCGTCVKDTDLFQRDITSLLNHQVAPVYNLVKQFCKLMPVFYNEIGAEGQLREVSTELDEIHRRGDLLIHFLRKQSHVESSNIIVDFIRATFRFWRTQDKRTLSSFLPAEILSQLREDGIYIDSQTRIMERLGRECRIREADELLCWEAAQLRGWLDLQEDIEATERRRFELLVAMFRLVHQKYNLSLQETRAELLQAAQAGFAAMEELVAILDAGDSFQSLAAILRCLEELKSVILSAETFPPREDIYYKRHIAVDIPSVYGRYRERKFDALGLALRLENLAVVYFERLPATINLSFITRATFLRILAYLQLCKKALELDGITGRRLETYLTLLASSTEQERFSYTQYIDIFRGLSEGVKDIIYAFYTNIHQDNLSIILTQIERPVLLPRYQSLWDDGDLTATAASLSEAFFRDLIAGTFGLQHLDIFITRVIQTLENQKNLLPADQLNLLMSYNPDRAICFLHRPEAATSNLIHMGNKGYNLMQLVAEGKPVPPAFVITTEIFRCRPVLESFSTARADFLQRLRNAVTELETVTGKRYGDPARPLLLSVRSGAPISMPGMMATVHNVGLNCELALEFGAASGTAFLAWDNWRRFLQSWAMTLGLNRDIFQKLMNSAKTRYNVPEKRFFTAEQMRELALSYQATLEDYGMVVPEDPWLQLTMAVDMVLKSWETKKTREYRKIIDISDSWGTAVIVQTMVYGNLGENAGTGVVFTANPYRKLLRVALWGDYATNDQGEDIVSGLVTSYPISVEQAEIDRRDPAMTLEQCFPEVYQALLGHCRDLVYTKDWTPQEIEFTFEGPQASDLFILQSRDMITIKKRERFFVFVPGEELKQSLLDHGIGVNGSALSGRAAFSEQDLLRLRSEDAATPLILVRRDTVPEDIKIIAMADGLLTSRGGQTSHASVVATRLDKTCVVGCKELKVYEANGHASIGGATIHAGNPISIDGRNGTFYLGAHPVQEEIHILPL